MYRSFYAALIAIFTLSACSGDDSDRPRPVDAGLDSSDEESADQLASEPAPEAAADSDAAEAPETKAYSWKPTSSTSAPSPRQTAAAVWTGNSMFVWGGGDGQGEFSSGGLYNPTTDSWKATNTANPPAGRLVHTAVWTGSKVLVWGGGKYLAAFNDGAAYDPATDAWSSLTLVGAPQPRTGHVAIWTGTKMLVWGGYDVTPYAQEAGAGQYLSDGAAYDPTTDAWSPISDTGAPSPREVAKAVWTGTKMIVWGGSRSGQNPVAGAMYDPALDAWTNISINGAPKGRIGHSLVWTGSKMVVWGGIDTKNHQLLADGAAYDPATDSWQAISTTGAPSKRERHATVWTGSKMLVWGGTDTTYLADGAAYDPATDSWQSLPMTSPLSGRMEQVSVWTGSAMIVWGGYGGPGVGFLDNGGVLTP